MSGVNRENKDRVFRMIFGYEKYKENLLSLFNALNDTNYTNVDDLEIDTLDDVFYMKMKNDVSCIIDSRLAVYEHQSTWSYNMPMRGFRYSAELYNKYIIKITLIYLEEDWLSSQHHNTTYFIMEMRTNLKKKY